MTIKRIGLYARVSSKRQTDERTIESQIAALKERALNSGESIRVFAKLKPTVLQAF